MSKYSMYLHDIRRLRYVSKQALGGIKRDKMICTDLNLVTVVRPNRRDVAGTK
jgi:hypothetical protein